LVKLALRLGLYTSRYKYFSTLCRRLIEVISSSKRKVVCLDFGCGDGFFTRLLASSCVFAIGIDLKKHNAWHIRQGNKSAFIVADARSIPLRSYVADVVIVLSLLEHVPSWRSVISEASRSLRLGGVAIIQLPNLHGIVEPHTHLPLLSLMPARIRNLVTLAIFREILQWDCSVPEVIYALRSSGLKVLGTLRYSYMKSLGSLSFAYFIVAMKTRDSKDVDARFRKFDIEGHATEICLLKK